MSALEKAEQAVQKASEQSDVLAVALAEIKQLRAQQAAQPAVVPAPQRPVVHVSGGAIAAGTAAVLIVGSVLVSMLLAVAVTAASVAVCAVVLRSMLNSRR